MAQTSLIGRGDPPHARVVRVAFWDFFHGQAGVAPKAIELHPILSFACLSG